MLNQVKFDTLVTAITEPSHRPGAKARLIIAKKPEPFVSPGLQTHGGSPQDGLSAEVLFIEAGAAVGKSTMANQLSAVRNLPMLNLADVPVATGSLRALISDLQGTEDPIQTFHAGKLPVIIDALDEGRMLSGEKGFESFLQTTGELILSNRSVKDRPKLVIFGRHESTELAKLGLELSGAGITICSIEVGYFAEQDAWALVDAYARSATKSNSAYRSHQEPARVLIRAYFDAIEAALGIGKGTLWSNEDGRAFAGYAPVLAALGLLLADMDNFIDVTNQLRSEGAKEAWGVIARVVEEILKREQGKLTSQLGKHITGAVPEDAYSVQEQLTLLVQRTLGKPLAGSGRVRLPSQDQATYDSMVERYIEEHPFIREGRLGNVVLSSIVHSHAIYLDLFKGSELNPLTSLSRQPFLWRSLRRYLMEDSLIDGRYLGYILGSLWTDPVMKNQRIAIRSTQDGCASTYVSKDGNTSRILNVTLPLSFYGQAQDCDVDVQDTVRLEGHPRGSETVFNLQGTNIFVCQTIEIVADSLVLDGKAWFEAKGITSPPRLNLSLKAGAQVGWAGAFSGQYPWNRFPSTLTAPYAAQGQGSLATLIEECWRRLPDSGMLTLSPDFTVAGDVRLLWAVRLFRNEFPLMLKLMVKHGLASKGTSEASGDPKITIRPKFTWQIVLSAIRDPQADSSLRTFLDDARRQIGS